MFKLTLAVSGIALIFSAATASSETFNQEFCKKEHPGDVTNCVRYFERQDHKLFTGDNGPAAPSAPSSETIPYDAANEARKLRLRKPVAGEIIMDSGPAKEIPLK
jgi:hypothetical protein